MYYPPSPEKPPPWWLEAFVITKAVFGIMFWPFAAIVVSVIGVFGFFFLFSLHWAFGLLLLGIMVAAFILFALWEKHRSPARLD